MNADAELIHTLRGAIVREYAAEFGYVHQDAAAPSPAPDVNTSGVIPLRHSSPIGIVYGSGYWQGNVLTTAAHVTEGVEGFTGQLVEMVAQRLRVSSSEVRCYRLARPAGTEALFIDGASADAHLIGTRAAVSALKASCPSPADVEASMGWPLNNPVEEVFAPVLLSEGFPAGDQTGAPEKRYLSRYTRLGPVGGLYGFYTSLSRDEALVGDTLGGNSGGRGSLLPDGRHIGPIVRAGPSGGDQYITVIQPLTSEMGLIPA